MNKASCALFMSDEVSIMPIVFAHLCRNWPAAYMYILIRKLID